MVVVGNPDFHFGFACVLMSQESNRYIAFLALPLYSSPTRIEYPQQQPFSHVNVTLVDPIHIVRKRLLLGITSHHLISPTLSSSQIPLYEFPDSESTSGRSPTEKTTPPPTIVINIMKLFFRVAVPLFLSPPHSLYYSLL
jgi:hypothetical protein